MPRRKQIPSYRLHKQSGQAIVTLTDAVGRRRDVLLGRFGTPESRAEYARHLAEWEASGRPAVAIRPRDQLTVEKLILAFLEYAETRYGSQAKEYANFLGALRPLRRLYGPTPACRFGPKSLKAIQYAMASGSWMNEEEKAKAQKRGKPIAWCRNVVNKQINRLKTVFRWAESEELVPPASHHALQTVRGLPKNLPGVRHTKPTKPVPWEHVEAVIQQCTPTVGTMLHLQWLTGMRSCEVRLMRTCDIEKRGSECWYYQPMKHKNDWRDNDQQRLIALGPKCIEILTRWLRPDDPAAFLFQPRRAAAERNARRRAERRSPLTPSQRARRPKLNPKRPPCDRYSGSAIRLPSLTLARKPA
jgi:integrase